MTKNVLILVIIILSSKTLNHYVFIKVKSYNKDRLSLNTKNPSQLTSKRETHIPFLTLGLDVFQNLGVFTF